MQFSTKEDIEAPIGEVFGALSDFEGFERSAIRRGIEVERRGGSNRHAAGAAWDATFTMRGKLRHLQLVLERFDAPNAIGFDGTSPGLNTRLDIELLALSPRRTRLAVVLNLEPQTLAARLLVQSLKLAKSSLTKRFKLKVADFAKTVEDRQNRIA